jgi:2-polyprenyl-3-methyl-5-hydroxy-6-metoxy-1,4-benzoquinol methylase
MSEDLRSRVRRLAAESTDGMSWFEDLYAAAQGDMAQIPWADRRPNRSLIAWLERERPSPRGASGRALKTLVVGCGLGEDAELLSRWQFDVTAFDLSQTAIDWCKQRYPTSRVKYEQGDLFTPRAQWVRGFDFVFEAYTVQPLPMTMRKAALEAVANLVAPGGKLLFITRARDDDEETDGPPWPLTIGDLRAISDAGLTMQSFEDYMDEEEPPVRRFRALYERV